MPVETIGSETQVRRVASKKIVPMPWNGIYPHANGDVFSTAFCEVLVLGETVRRKVWSDPYFIEKADWWLKEDRADERSKHTLMKEDIMRGYVNGQIGLSRLVLIQDLENINTAYASHAAIVITTLGETTQEKGLIPDAINSAYEILLHRDVLTRLKVRQLTKAYAKGNTPVVRRLTLELISS